MHDELTYYAYKYTTMQASQGSRTTRLTFSCTEFLELGW